MSKKDLMSSEVISRKEKAINIIVFLLLSIGAISMVFPSLSKIIPQAGVPPALHIPPHPLSNRPHQSHPQNSG